MNKYLVFENTNLYQTFGKCLSVQIITLSIQDYDWYKVQLQDLLKEFGVDKLLPAIYQMDEYIEANEDINIEDVPLFHQFIKALFEKLFTISKHLDKLYVKNEAKKLKKQEKEMEQERKNKEKQENDILNSEMIECPKCGEHHTRGTTRYHITSNSHLIGIRAIEWYLKSHS